MSLSEEAEKKKMIKEIIQLKLANRLMDEEMARMAPELAKYDTSMVHPAARPIQTESVSTVSLTDKTVDIKQGTAKLKVLENDLTGLNDQVTTLFKDVETKVARRDSLFSEVEKVTSQMSSLTVDCTQFEDDSGKVEDATHNESEQLAEMTKAFQERMKVKLAKVASLKKTKSDLDNVITTNQQRIKELRALNAEYDRRLAVDSLSPQKAKLDEMKEKVAKLSDHLATVNKEEGERLEAVTSLITERELLKKKKDELSKQLEEITANEEKTAIAVDEEKKRVDAVRAGIDQLESKKELLKKNHEKLMSERKEQSDTLIESLKAKKKTAEMNQEAITKRIQTREECLILKKELDAMGNIKPLDLSTEIASLKQEIEDTRTKIAKKQNDSEHYRVATVKNNAEVKDMTIVYRQRRQLDATELQEKEEVAIRIENKVCYLKKKLEQEKAEKAERMAQETRRLLEKAKDDKKRREKEERRKMEREEEKKKMEREKEKKKMEREKEKEEMKKMEKMRKVKEEEEKQKKKAKEEIEKQAKKKKEEEKKKMEEEEEEKKRVMNAIQKEATTSGLVSRVQQRRMSREPAASNDGVVMRPQTAHRPLPPVPNIRSLSKRPIVIFDDDSSDDDDDDMNDFLMEDSARVMLKVPEKYAGSPLRVPKKANPFELSFADVECSTPLRPTRDPAPALDLSFNQVVTSTPQIESGSKANKKQTRPRGKGGKKRSK